MVIAVLGARVLPAAIADDRCQPSTLKIISQRYAKAVLEFIKVGNGIALAEPGAERKIITGLAGIEEN